MVSISVSKMGMTELIFVVSGMKINGQYYRDVLLSQHILPAIEHVAGDRFVFQQDNVPSHRARTLKHLQQETPDVIGPDLWPPNSPDLNLVDYKVWCVMQQRVYECSMNSVDKLKLRLDVWNSLQQNVIDAAINDWRKQLRPCVHTNGQQFEHLLRARVTNKSYGQIKYKYNSKRCSFTSELVIFGVLTFPKVRYVQ